MMLEVGGLSCGYGNVVAVHDLSFTIGAGEMLGLLGANGAGKSATIMALAGLIPVRAGTVRLDGRDITSLPAYARVSEGIAVVPEGRRVFADLTVDENLTVGGMRVDARACEHNRSKVFETFPRLAERCRQLAGSLSGGEQQMLAIGRGMMASPAVLLIDELSLGLMPIVIDECYSVLSRLREEGLAILLVEQSTERVLRTANKIAVLESGRVAWKGTSLDASGDESILDAYLGSGEWEIAPRPPRPRST